MKNYITIITDNSHGARVVRLGAYPKHKVRKLAALVDKSALWKELLSLVERYYPNDKLTVIEVSGMYNLSIEV